MAAKIHEIDPGPHSPKVVRMIVEIPKNSRNKYEYDKEFGIFRLDRFLYSPMHYPGDYGFIPGTLGEDGDPLDVLTVTEEPSFTGCMVEVRPVGVLRMIDRSEPDQKILAVQQNNPLYNEVDSVKQLFAHLRREIEHFFTIYKELEHKKTRILGWSGPAAAHKIIAASRRRYLQDTDRFK
ncbi:MAG TPA: inorganic diphosphatase [Candidatus Acidoferrales bacterium]|nr:inorganic diphosphatase [Candidatus Acidoferrales bacterium]